MTTIGAVLLTVGVLIVLFRAIAAGWPGLNQVTLKASLHGQISKGLLAAGLPLGIILIGLGAVTTVAPSFMSGARGIDPEYRRRLNDEYNAIMERCARETKQMNEERSDALSRVEPASQAVGIRTAAIRTALNRRVEAERNAANELDAAYQTAERERETVLLNATPEGQRRTLTLARARARADAEDGYNDELAAARRRPTLAQREQALTAAREKRGAALQKAERDYTRGIEDANEQVGQATRDALEKAIRTVEIARRDEADKRESALRVYEQACRDADAALELALASSPATRLVVEEFETRLKEVTGRCEEEKRRLLDQGRPTR